MLCVVLRLLFEFYSFNLTLDKFIHKNYVFYKHSHNVEKEGRIQVLTGYKKVYESEELVEEALVGNDVRYKYKTIRYEVYKARLSKNKEQVIKQFFAI